MGMSVTLPHRAGPQEGSTHRRHGSFPPLDSHITLRVRRGQGLLPWKLQEDPSPHPPRPHVLRTPLAHRALLCCWSWCNTVPENTLALGCMSLPALLAWCGKQAEGRPWGQIQFRIHLLQLAAVLGAQFPHLSSSFLHRVIVQT